MIHKKLYKKGSSKVQWQHFAIFSGKATSQRFKWKFSKNKVQRVPSRGVRGSWETQIHKDTKTCQLGDV